MIEYNFVLFQFLRNYWNSSPSLAFNMFMAITNGYLEVECPTHSTPWATFDLELIEKVNRSPNNHGLTRIHC